MCNFPLKHKHLSVSETERTRPPLLSLVQKVRGISQMANVMIRSETLDVAYFHLTLQTFQVVIRLLCPIYLAKCPEPCSQCPLAVVFVHTSKCCFTLTLMKNSLTYNASVVLLSRWSLKLNYCPKNF